MIFVVVGSQKFPFERLIREVDLLKEKGIIVDDVFAQIGPSSYIPRHLRWERYLDKGLFDEMIQKCDLLVTHAGEGSIMTGLLCRKKVIAVPRYARLGEHVSDHQLEIARALEKQHNIINVEKIEDLGRSIQTIDQCDLRPYRSEKQKIIETISSFIG